MCGGLGGFKGWWELVPFVASASLVLYTLVGVWVQSGVGIPLLWFHFLLCCLKDVVETMYNEGVSTEDEEHHKVLEMAFIIIIHVHFHQHAKA